MADLVSSKGRVALRVEELRVHYHTERGAVRAVEGIDFELRAGERLGLVGESGSGKSTTAMALMRLIRPPGRIEGGRIHLGELELLTLSEEEMRRVRFARISLIPQGVMNSLNPVMRVGAQIADTIEAHEERPTREELASRNIIKGARLLVIAEYQYTDTSILVLNLSTRCWIHPLARQKRIQGKRS